MRYMQSLFVIGSLFLASVASAQVEITEIMYDLEGSDTGKEWVEVHNSGSEPVNLSTWRFVEADTNHKLSVVSGDGTLEAGGFALITDDTNPGFAGDVFKSSFSLSNTGEKIGVRDEALNDVDMVTYSSDMGAVGDGASLQKIGGVWKASVPTPGLQNVFSNPPVPAPSTVAPSSQTASAKSSQPTTQTSSGSTQVSSATVSKPQLTVSAGERERIGIAGAGVVFDGTARGSSGEDVSSAHFVWNFGDGSSGEGKHVEHTYQYAGEYAVVLDVTSGAYTATDKVKVSVIPADIVVSKVGDTKDFFVEIANNTAYEVNLSGWKLKAGTATFVFPKGTFMFPKKCITIGQKITGFVYTTDVSLLYPSGVAVFTYGNDDSVEFTSSQSGNFLSNDDVILTEAGGVKSSASLVKSIINTVDASILQNEQSSSTDALIKGNVAQMANASDSASGSDNPDGLFWGLIGVVLLSLIATYAVLDRKPIDTTPGIKSEADLYKVIEIED